MEYIAHLSNGQIIELDDPQFEAESFTRTLNEQNIHFVNIGNAVINKHLIQLIIPIDEIDTIDPIDEIDTIDPIDEIDTIDPIDEIDTIDPIDEIDTQE